MRHFDNSVREVIEGKLPEQLAYVIEQIPTPKERLRETIKQNLAPKDNDAEKR